MVTPSSSAPQPNPADLIVLRAVYIVTSIGLFVTGVGFLSGPSTWRSARAYSVLARMMPVDVWAWSFLGIGLLKIMLIIVRSKPGEHLRLGSALGGMIALGWAGGQIAAAATTGIMAWGSIPAWLTIAGVQLISVARIWR